MRGDNDNTTVPTLSYPSVNPKAAKLRSRSTDDHVVGSHINPKQVRHSEQRQVGVRAVHGLRLPRAGGRRLPRNQICAPRAALAC
eukprot:3688297-Pyramimonas_sp.AAC.2